MRVTSIGGEKKTRLTIEIREKFYVEIADQRFSYSISNTTHKFNS